MSAVAVLPSFLRWQSLPFRVLRVWVFWPRTCWRVWAETSATRGREKNPVTSILEEVNRRSIEAGCAKGGKGLSREWHRRNEHLYVTSPQFHYHFASWYVYAKPPSDTFSSLQAGGDMHVVVELRDIVAEEHTMFRFRHFRSGGRAN